MKKKKYSVRKAQRYNALLPGLGYAYVGQKNTAFTSFTINALFIAAIVKLIEKEHYAAAAIATSLESGWYIGGIYGAGMAAQSYNQSLFSKGMNPLLQREKYFPIQILDYHF